MACPVPVISSSSSRAAVWPSSYFGCTTEVSGIGTSATTRDVVVPDHQQVVGDRPGRRERPADTDGEQVVGAEDGVHARPGPDNLQGRLDPAGDGHDRRHDLDQGVLGQPGPGDRPAGAAPAVDALPQPARPVDQHDRAGAAGDQVLDGELAAEHVVDRGGTRGPGRGGRVHQHHLGAAVAHLVDRGQRAADRVDQQAGGALLLLQDGA